MRVAIVHDWITGMRGGEKCLEVFCEIFPEADIFTLLYLPGSVSKIIESHSIKTSPIQYIPCVGSWYRYFLPVMPFAVRMLDLSGYDFILSSSHCVAKGARGDDSAYHLCYCYTPMRYAWSAYDDYFGENRVNCTTRFIIPRVMRSLRRWDVESSRGVHEFVAISHTVADRIRRHYGRESEVLYPPVDTRGFKPGGKTEDYYLVVSAFAPYKKVDVAVEAFNRLGRPLKVVGGGQDFERIRMMGKSNVEFLGWQDTDALASLYAGCRAFIFPGVEDFGITPLEAQACGRPVIALGEGGTLETVVALNRDEYTPPPGVSRWEDLGENPGGPTGFFFKRPEVDEVIKGVLAFEKTENIFCPEVARRQAEQFCRERFMNAARELFFRSWEVHHKHLFQPAER